MWQLPIWLTNVKPHACKSCQMAEKDPPKAATCRALVAPRVPSSRDPKNETFVPSSHFS